jgi:ubiquinone/menaquinone biosynthesis C-methylase UbiE
VAPARRLDVTGADLTRSPEELDMSGEPVRRETYTHGHAPAVVRQHAQRTAAEAAAFLLPELRRGMSILDVGCGPGSITRGLAEHVAPGPVVGVDLSRETLEAARRDAVARGLDNLQYQEGSVYALPFADAAFDVVYAHQVLQHLRERDGALREMLRVIRPGGLVAVRDVDWGTVAYWPRDPWIDRFIDVHQKAWYRNGGEPQLGRQLRALFNAAGVEELRITAAVWCYATPEETIAWGDSYADRLLSSPMGESPVAHGLASRADVEMMASAFRAWARHPDALWVFTHVEALAAKPT